MISEKTHKALSILADNPNISATSFAEKFWGEDSKMFQMTKNIGHGATKGSAAWLCAGSYLAKLAGKGLVFKKLKVATTYSISAKGKKAIAAFEKKKA